MKGMFLSDGESGDINRTEAIKPVRYQLPNIVQHEPFEFSSDYLKSRLNLDLYIANLKTISNQLHCEYSDGTAAGKPCVTKGDSVDTTCKEKIIEPEIPKETKITKSTSRIKVSAKKHSCVNIIPTIEIKKQPPKRVTPKSVSRSSRTALNLKFEDIHPDLELESTGGSTVFPRRVPKRLSTRTSRTDPKGDRHPKASQKTPSTWHELLQQCTVDNLKEIFSENREKIINSQDIKDEMEREKKNPIIPIIDELKLDPIDENQIQSDRSPFKAKREKCNIQIIPPLNITKMCSVQILQPIILSSDGAEKVHRENTKLWQVVHQTPEKQTRSNAQEIESQISSNNELIDIYIRPQTADRVIKTYPNKRKPKEIKTIICLDRNSEDDSFVLNSNNQETSRQPEEYVINDCDKFDFHRRYSLSCDEIIYLENYKRGTEITPPNEKSPVKSSSSERSFPISSRKMFQYSSQSIGRHQSVRNIDKILGIKSGDEGNDQVTKPVSKGKIRKKRRAYKKRSQNSTSSDDDIGSPILACLTINPNEFIDLIDDVFETSPEEKSPARSVEVRTSNVDNNNYIPMLTDRSELKLDENCSNKHFDGDTTPDMLESKPTVTTRSPIVLNNLMEKSSVSNLIENIREKIASLNHENNRVIIEPSVTAEMAEEHNENGVQTTCECIHCIHMKYAMLPGDLNRCNKFHASVHCTDVFHKDSFTSNMNRNLKQTSSEQSCSGSTLISLSSPTTSHTNMSIKQDNLLKDPLPSERYKQIKRYITSTQDERVTKTINNIYASAKQFARTKMNENSIQESYKDCDQIQNAARKFLKSVRKEREIQANLLCAHSSNESSVINAVEGDGKDIEQLMYTNSEESADDSLNCF